MRSFNRLSREPIRFLLHAMHPVAVPVVQPLLAPALGLDNLLRLSSFDQGLCLATLNTFRQIFLAQQYHILLRIHNPWRQRNPPAIGGALLALSCTSRRPPLLR